MWTRRSANSTNRRRQGGVSVSVSSMQERLVAIACVLAVIAVSAASGSDETGAARRRSDGSKGSGEWRITLYTGNKLWAGTDSDLYVELIGTNGNSNIIRLQPRPSQLEADDVDTFSLGTLEGRDIGALKQIVVAKQHSYAFFNDWELVKAEVSSTRFFSIINLIGHLIFRGIKF